MVDLGKSSIRKIDDLAVNGLSGVDDSLAYKVNEIEKHLHGYESWFGVAAVPTGTHLADRVGSGTDEPFQLDAGNDTWGAWVQLLGTDDTPARTGMLKYDPHQITVSNTERNATYFLQFGYGASGAAALAADTYTEVVFVPISNQVDSGPVQIMMNRADIDTLLWARTWCRDQNTATIDFYLGIHEYIG